MRSLFLTLTLIIGVWTLPGCGASGSDAVETPTPKAQAAWNVEVDGIKFNIPDNWKVYNFRKDEFSTLIKQAERENPQHAMMINQARDAVQSGMLRTFIFRMDNSDSSFAENLNIVITPSPQKGLTAKMLLDALGSQMSTLMAKDHPFESKIITLQVGETVYTSGVIKLNDQELRSIGYNFFKGDEIVSVTFSALNKNKLAMQKFADEVMKTTFTD